MLDVAHPDLIADIEAFCDQRGMPITTFGFRAVGDPSFVKTLREGRECRRRTVRKVREFMENPDLWEGQS